MLGGHWQGRGQVGPLFDAGNIIYIYIYINFRDNYTGIDICSYLSRCILVTYAL